MRSTNPVFRDKISESVNISADMPMTVSGTMNKLLILSAVMLFSAYAVYYQFSLKHFDYFNLLTWGGLIVGFIIALVISFNPKSSPFLAPVYAFAEGAAISGISCSFESEFSGIIIQAVSITMFTVVSVAVLYKTGIIKATDKFRSIIFSATAAIALFYLVSIILSFFHIAVPYFTSNSQGAIAINAIIAVIAALNLIIDFDNIDMLSKRLAPSYFEWYGAFGLLVTIVWLYIEILRLLSRVRSR